MSFLFGSFGRPDAVKLGVNHDIEGLVKALGYQIDFTVVKLAVKALVEIIL